MSDLPIKDYKIKEALVNLKQSFDDLKDKFVIMVDVLNEIEEERKNDLYEDTK